MKRQTAYVDFRCDGCDKVVSRWPNAKVHYDPVGKICGRLHRTTPRKCGCCGQEIIPPPQPLDYQI